jgi:hypothetical protein
MALSAACGPNGLNCAAPVDDRISLCYTDVDTPMRLSNAIPSPEEDELGHKREEFERLRLALGERELELSTLQNELRAFETRYLSIVGTRFVTLDDLEAQLAELQAAQRPDDDHLKAIADEARFKANETARASTTDNHALDTSFVATDELKSLYRDIAKIVHPDLAADEATRERRHRFMAHANAAYAARDIDGLRAVLREWLSSPENVEGQGVVADLIRVIRQIAQVQRRLREIGQELQELRAGQLFALYQQSCEANDVGRDLLAEMAQEVERRIAAVRMRLNSTASSVGYP